MSFLNPFWLVGLSALSIPIIIHLLNFRKPEVVAFSTLAFFEELKKTAIRRIKLKQWLLLVVRLLLIAFAVLALARPIIPVGGWFSAGNEPVTWMVMVDNSLSMSRLDENGPYLDQAKKVVQEIIQRAQPEDRFILISTHHEASSFLPLSASEALKRAENIQVQWHADVLEDRFRYVIELMRQKPDLKYRIIMIGDAQESTLSTQMSFMQQQLQAATLTEQVGLVYVAVGSDQQENVVTEAIRLTQKMVSIDKPIPIEAEVVNLGKSTAQNVFLTLYQQDKAGGQYRFDMASGERKRFNFEVVADETGNASGYVLLEGDAFSADNKRWFSITVPQSKSVLVVHPKRSISGRADYMRSVLQAAQETNTQLRVSYAEAELLAQRNLAEYDAIVLDQLVELPAYMREQLQRFVEQGNRLLIIPAYNGKSDHYNDLLHLVRAGRFQGIRGEYGVVNSIARFNSVREDHPILETIFETKPDEPIRILPSDIYYQWVYLPGTSGSERVILANSVNDPLLIEHNAGNGKVLMFTLGTDPGWSNLSSNPFFAPLMYRTVLYTASGEFSTNVEFILSTSFSWKFESTPKEVSLRQDGIVILPELWPLAQGMSIRANVAEWQPGIVELTSGQNVLTRIAVNLPMDESNLAQADKSRFEAFQKEYPWLKSVIQLSDVSTSSVQEAVQRAGIGKEIWMWFLSLALLMLVAESLISTLFKAESNS